MKKVYVLLCIACFTLAFYQCSSAYHLEKASVLEPNRPYYQSWTAGIKADGTGINVYFPNLNANNAVTLDSIYFQGLKGKLLKRRALYFAQLKHKSPYDRDMSIEASFQKVKKTSFPFKLLPTDCVISYLENGERKYLKISGLTEKEGVYYPEGLAVQEIDD